MSVKSPYNRLNNAARVWRNARSSRYILEVIEKGYKFPFEEVPVSQKCRNNRSSRDNPGFVCDEIRNLLAKGCISKVSYVPVVISP